MDFRNFIIKKYNIPYNKKVNIKALIDIGIYRIIIEAGSLCYSNPNTSANIYDYKNYEINIVKNKSIINPVYDDNLKEFKRLKELITYFKIDYVFRIYNGEYVPYDLLQDLINYLEYITLCNTIIEQYKI